MFSIYTSLYNLSGGFIDYKAALDNFCSFADEVVVGTTMDSKDDTIELLQEYQNINYKVKLAITDFKLNTAEFDGQIKNAALKLCTKKFCILLDGDEEIPLYTKDYWMKYANFIKDREDIDGVLIPSINLCGDKYHYKDIGYKFYLHKNEIGIERGIVNYAKLSNGKINTKLSDTTEPIINGELAKFIGLSNILEDIKDNKLPFVFHHWGDNAENRIKQNKFWSPIWASRSGKKADDIIVDKNELNLIQKYPHNLLI